MTNTNNKNLVVTNIEWDTDGEDCALPSEVTVPANIMVKIDEIISDYLSDEFSFAHKGFALALK